MTPILCREYSPPTIGNVGIASVRWLVPVISSDIDLNCVRQGSACVIDGQLDIFNKLGVRWPESMVPPLDWPLDVLMSVEEGLVRFREMMEEGNP